MSINALGQVMTVLNELLLARLMGIQLYGVFAVIQSIVLIASDLGDFGVSPATSRYLGISLGESNWKSTRQIIKASATIKALCSVILTLALLMLSKLLVSWMNMFETGSALMVFILFIPLIFLNKISEQWLKGLGRIRTQIFLNSFVINVAKLIFCFNLWLLTESLAWVVFGYGLSYTVSGIVSLFIVLKTVKALPQENEQQVKNIVTIRTLVFHGLPIMLSAMGARLFRRGDVLVLAAMLDQRTVGLYRVAYVLISGVTKFIKPINDFALFYMARGYGRKQLSDVFNHYHLSILIRVTIGVPIYVILFLIPAQLLGLLFGIEYVPAEGMVRILVVGFSSFICVGSVGGLFNVLGKNWARLYIMLSMGLSNIFLNILFIHFLGANGAAWGTSTCFILTYLLYRRYIYQGVDNIEVERHHIRILILAGLLSVTVALIPQSLINIKYLLAVLLVLFLFSYGAIQTRQMFLKIGD